MMSLPEPPEAVIGLGADGLPELALAALVALAMAWLRLASACCQSAALFAACAAVPATAM